LEIAEASGFYRPDAYLSP